LNFDEFFRVSQCASAKEMLDILELTHEGKEACLDPRIRNV